MSATRQRILLFLKSYQPASIRDIGTALGLTSPDILYHIQSLLKNGEIELFQSEFKSPSKRGRPVKRYRLRQQNIPENYDHLTSSLLAVYLSQFISDEGKNNGLKILAKNFLPDDSPINSLKTRIAHLINHLSAHHYAARWEAHHQGPQIIFANCPYQTLLSAHPELCTLDGYILENYLNLPVAMLQNIFDNVRSPRVCRFMVETES